jgi:hypothetical protein
MELQITEKEECLGKVYIDSRFDTIEDSFMYSPLDVVVIVQFLEQYGRVLRSTYGHEVSWKVNKPHSHWRCELQLEKGKKQIPKGSISQTFKYYIEKQKKLILQKGKYYFKTIIPKKDLETFFQYHYKDYENYEDIEQDLQFGFTSQEVRELWIRSRECNRVRLESYLKHEHKKNNEILEYDKLKSYIDNHLRKDIVMLYHNEVGRRVLEQSDDGIYNSISDSYKLGTFRQMQSHIGTLIIQYYMEEHDNKVPYGNKIVSLFNRYCLHSKIFGAEDLCSIIFKL